MHSKKLLLTNFSHAIYSDSFCIKPDTLHDLNAYIAKKKPQPLLARGAGLSYGDSCFNKDGYVILNDRFNHLLHFDIDTQVVSCQGGVTLKDLFLVHPEFIPPVIPGTLHATVAGAVAHDVHGKNNHKEGSFGQHVVWLDLLLNGQIVHCSPGEQSDLFYSTIAGIGLTGLITNVGIRLKKASHFVEVEHLQFSSLTALTEYMHSPGLDFDYQVAWLDLLNPSPKAILSLAKHCDPFTAKEHKVHTVPKTPFRLIYPWNMKLFNQLYFNTSHEKQKLALEQFNNPLDKIHNWNRLYGPKGLIQFQAVFRQEQVSPILEELLQIIKIHKATPTLAVLKYFTKKGHGLLSFCKPGFTLAIDFIHNKQAADAITSMNQYLTDNNGLIYLAKDLYLTPNQFNTMYTKQEQFKTILSQYQCNFRSDMSKRLGITQ